MDELRVAKEKLFRVLCVLERPDINGPVLADQIRAAMRSTPEENRAMDEMFSDDKLGEIFSYHAPDKDQIPKYGAIRDAALAFAKVIRDNTPASADQTVAIRKLRESVMVANASIALKGGC